jgi:excisionase family DNA binding protein
MSDVDDLSLEEAAVELGVSPVTVIRLLESGQLESHLDPDGRRRRISLATLEQHRNDRFALRQQMVQEQRARRWPDPDAMPDDLGDESSVTAR